jgi:hypothetical protein
MMSLARHIVVAVVVLAVWAAGSAAAQENLDKGKAPDQLYASDCAICHKSPRGLAKGVGRFGLENFLREHYTASRESAAVISAYLRAVDSQPEPRREHGPKRRAKASKPKLPPSKSSETNASDAKPSNAKPSQSKIKASTDQRDEAKTSSPKAGEPKPSEPKPAAAQPAEAKAEARKVSPAKPAQDSAGPKPDKSN